MSSLGQRAGPALWGILMQETVYPYLFPFQQVLSLTIFIQPRGVYAPGSHPGTHLPPELLVGDAP